jgi:competence protein ComEC
LILTAGFVLGEALGLFGALAVWMTVIVTLAFGLALLLCLLGEELTGAFWMKEEKSCLGSRKNKTLKKWILWGLVFLCAGFCRGRQAVEWSKREQGLMLDGVRGTLWGTLDSVKKSGEYQVFGLKDCTVRRQVSFPEEREISDKLNQVQVYVKENHKKSPRPQIGARIQATGALSCYGQARNPGEFDYQLYYRSLGLNYRMFADSWQEVKAGYGWGREILYQWSEYAGQLLDKISAPQDCGIYRAVLLGDKSQLEAGIRRLYQENGIAHLLAISGLHLSIISSAVYGGLRKAGAGYGKAGIAGGLILIGYAIMTGASPSVIRACVMVLSGFLATYLGRTYDLFSAMGVAAILLLWKNPYLMLQGGVQLSFGAVAGIGISVDTAKKGGLKVLKSGVIMQLVTLPVILYHFFQIPLYGIFLNLLVVPLMGGVIAFGVAGIFLGSIYLPWGRLAAGSGHLILKLYEYLCSVWSALPLSSLILGRPALWQIWIYIGFFGAAIWLWKRGVRRRGAILLIASPLVLLPVPVWGMEITFLDVGQGDGLCIHTQTKTILVDGGSTDQKKLGENCLEPFLKSRGISAVDYAIVSHGDQDHISGLVYLMEESRIGIKSLVLPAAGKGDKIYDRLEELVKARGGAVLWMERGDRIKLGGMDIYCHYPPKGEKDKEDYGIRTAADRNEHSLVLQVNYGDFHMLLTGDMSGEGEKRLLALERENTSAQELKEIQVLKVAHHGSSHSTTRLWIESIQPVWAVISYGEKNRYGHPGREVLRILEENNVKIFKTAQKGAVILKTDGRKMSLRTMILSESPLVP